MSEDDDNVVSNEGESTVSDAVEAEHTDNDNNSSEPTKGAEQKVTDSLADNKGVVGSGGAQLDVASRSPKKKKTGLLVGVIVAVLIVVLGGGSAFAYFGWYQNPNKVVSDALLGVVSSTNTLSGAKASLEYTDDQSQTFNVDVTAKLDGANAQLDGTLKLTGTKAGSGQISYTSKGSIITTGDGKFYIKVNNVKDILTSLFASSGASFDLSIFDSVINKVNDSWVELDSKDLGDFTEKSDTSSKCFSDAQKTLSSDVAVKNELVSIYQNNQFIVAGKSLGSKNVNNTDSIGYEVIGDKDKATSFVKAFAESKLGKSLKDCDKTLDFDKMAFDLTAQDADDKTKVTVEVWVSRFGHQLSEVKITGDDGKQKLTAVVNPQFGQPAKIEIPSNPMTIDDIKTEIQSAMTSYYLGLYSSNQYDSLGV